MAKKIGLRSRVRLAKPFVEITARDFEAMVGSKKVADSLWVGFRAWVRCGQNADFCKTSEFVVRRLTRQGLGALIFAEGCGPGCSVPLGILQLVDA